MVEKASWYLGTSGQELGMVWKIERKLAKLSMNIFTYCSPSYLL
jgi:hypothetical protein